MSITRDRAQKSTSQQQRSTVRIIKALMPKMLDIEALLNLRQSSLSSNEREKEKKPEPKEREGYHYHGDDRSKLHKDGHSRFV